MFPADPTPYDLALDDRTELLSRISNALELLIITCDPGDPEAEEMGSQWDYVGDLEDDELPYLLQEIEGATRNVVARHRAEMAVAAE